MSNRTQGWSKARTRVSLAVTLIAFCTLANSQTADVESMITITGQKNRLTVPYKRAHEILKKTHEASHGKAEVYFQAVLRNPSADIKKTRIWLETGDGVQIIAVDDAGRFSLPLIDDALVDDAEVYSNLDKGNLSVKLMLRPSMRAEHLSISEGKATVDAARRVRTELLPWYARLFVPAVNGVGICYASTVAAEHGRQINFGATYVALVNQRNDLDQTLACLAIDEQTPDVAQFDSTGVVEVLFIESLF